jgi:hypothetical protein
VGRDQKARLQYVDELVKKNQGWQGRVSYLFMPVPVPFPGERGDHTLAEEAIAAVLSTGTEGFQL